MYSILLLVILALSMYYFRYENSNQCAFQMTLYNSFNYGVVSPLVNVTNKRIIRQQKGRHRIPSLIYQTSEKDQVPSEALNTVELILHFNPTFSYEFYNATERREFIKENFQPKVLKAYDKIIPKAFKADLWRYLMVFKNGGCYMDSGSYTVKSLLDVLRPNDTFVSTVDADFWGVNSAFFCAEASHPILKNNVDDIVEFVEKQEYGETVLSITGPHRFAKSFIKYFSLPLNETLDAKDYGNGIRLLDRKMNFWCLIARLVDQNDQTFVLSKYPGYYTDQKQYSSEPRYGELWNERKVYNKE